MMRENGSLFDRSNNIMTAALTDNRKVPESPLDKLAVKGQKQRKVLPLCHKRLASGGDRAEPIYKST